ncbi:PREDICTED: uncharacterized protein LOC109218242 [Nicotiana attenuata]|nr:PREDICTED: uncharacterized protein LOC109218242 [Nicotiana attenuata]
MSMWNYGTDVMDALMELLISLATSGAGGQYVDLCLEMLVNNFVPPPSFISLLNQPRGILRKGQVIIRVHSTLIDIAELVPLSPLRLEKIVKEKEAEDANQLHKGTIHHGICGEHVKTGGWSNWWSCWENHACGNYGLADRFGCRHRMG